MNQNNILKIYVQQINIYSLLKLLYFKNWIYK